MEIFLFLGGIATGILIAVYAEYDERKHQERMREIIENGYWYDWRS